MGFHKSNGLRFEERKEEKKKFVFLNFLDFKKMISKIDISFRVSRGSIFFLWRENNLIERKSQGRLLACLGIRARPRPPLAQGCSIRFRERSENWGRSKTYATPLHAIFFKQSQNIVLTYLRNNVFVDLVLKAKTKVLVYTRMLKFTYWIVSDLNL